MKFEQLISSASFDSEEFPRLSSIELEMFDGKNQRINEDLHFDEPLFNSIYANKFYQFLKRKESKNVLPKTIQGKITPEAIIIYWPNKFPEVFFRNRS